MVSQPFDSHGETARYYYYGPPKQSYGLIVERW